VIQVCDRSRGSDLLRGDDHVALLVEIDAGDRVHALAGGGPDGDTCEPDRDQRRDRQAHPERLAEGVASPGGSGDRVDDDPTHRDEHREGDGIGEDVQVCGRHGSLMSAAGGSAVVRIDRELTDGRRPASVVPPRDHDGNDFYLESSGWGPRCLHGLSRPISRLPADPQGLRLGISRARRAERR
jgi:hypothetical protein